MAGSAPRARRRTRRSAPAVALLAAASLLTAAGAQADSPPPLMRPGRDIPGPYPPCSAHADQYGTPGWLPVPGEFPCVSGWPSDEGWPSPSGAVTSITPTRVARIPYGESTASTASYAFTATIDQGPGSVFAHFGPECHYKGTLVGLDCHLESVIVDARGNVARVQVADFTAPDDRLWLAYTPRLYPLPARLPCSALWTQVLVLDELGLVPVTPGNPYITSTLPAKVAAPDAHATQEITGDVAIVQKPTPQAWRLCLTATMDTVPQKLRLVARGDGPLWILADAPFTVPAAAPVVKPLVFAEITKAARGRLTKLKAWRHGTGRRLKITDRARTTATLRATWHSRGPHPRRYKVTVTIRKAKAGITAKLGRVSRVS